VVEPGPSEDVITGSQLVRNLEVVLVGVLSIGVLGVISGLVLRRAASLNRMNNLPDRVLSRVFVGGERDLA
jgi:hypothetical protein